MEKDIYYGSNTPTKIENHKQAHGLTGDVYVVNHFIANLESHKKFFTDSTATTIEEAAEEMVAYLEEQEKLAEEQAQAQSEDEVTENSEEVA